ncbi:MAG TPA: hypothetical protein VE758_02935 [Chthoniobacterales bacterium]|nr:hypothetical protein [Chthoniobacterales bacterium]
MKALLLLMSILGAVAIVVADAQSPTTSSAQQLAPDTESLPSAIKLLQEMKTANAEVLKKQEAALQALEELQKAADEIKIFGKRS